MAARASGTAWLLDGAENPLAPPSVVADLKALSPRLGLQYHVAMHCFMVTLQWPEDDPRRALIQAGEMHPNADFELLCPVPATVSLDELRGWVERQLVRVGQSREDVRRMLAEQDAKAAAANDAAAAAKADAAREALVESIANPETVGKRRKRVTVTPEG